MEILNYKSLPPMQELDGLNHLYSNRHSNSNLPSIIGDDIPKRSPSGNVLAPAIGYHPDVPLSTKVYKKRRKAPKLDLDLTNLRVLD